MANQGKVVWPAKRASILDKPTEKFLEASLGKLPVEEVDSFLDQNPSLGQSIQEHLNSLEADLENEHINVLEILNYLSYDIKSREFNEFEPEDEAIRERLQDQLKKIMKSTTIAIAYFSSKEKQVMLLRHYILRCQAGLLFHFLSRKKNKSKTTSISIDHHCVIRLLQKHENRGTIPPQLRLVVSKLSQDVRNLKLDNNRLTLDSQDEGYSSLCNTPDKNSFQEQNQVKEYSSKTKGRFIRWNSKHSLKPTEEVFSEEPLVCVLRCQNSYSRCFHCIKEIKSKFFKCPNLCPVVFCSLKCYSEISCLHRKECPLLHLLFSVGIKGHMAFRALIDGNDIQHLAHHYQESEPSTKRLIFVDSLRVQGILKRLEDQSPSLSLIMITISRICLNNIVLTVQPYKVCGNAVYRAFSMICHSCSPNSVVTFQGRTLYVSASTTINPGEEVTVSYSSRKNTKERRDWLRKLYHFDCWCQKCFHGIVNSEDLSFYARKQTCPSCPTSLVDTIGRIEDSKAYDRYWGPKFQSHLTIKVECPLGCKTVNLSYYCNILKNTELSRSSFTSLRNSYRELLPLLESPNAMILCFQDSLSSFFLKVHDSRLSLSNHRYLQKSIIFAHKALITSLQLLGHHRITAFCLMRYLCLSMKYECTLDVFMIRHLFSKFEERSLIDFAIIEFNMTEQTRLRDIERWVKEQQPLFVNSSISSLGCISNTTHSRLF